MRAAEGYRALDFILAKTPRSWLREDSSIFGLWTFQVSFPRDQLKLGRPRSAETSAIEPDMDDAIFRLWVRAGINRLYVREHTGR